MLWKQKRLSGTRGKLERWSRKENLLTRTLHAMRTDQGVPQMVVFDKWKRCISAEDASEGILKYQNRGNDVLTPACVLLEPLLPTVAYKTICVEKGKAFVLPRLHRIMAIKYDWSFVEKSGFLKALARINRPVMLNLWRVPILLFIPLSVERR